MTLAATLQATPGAAAVSPPPPPFNVPDVDLLPTATRRKCWTRAACEFLEKTSLLKERYELLDGEIIVKAGQQERHDSSLMRVIAYCLSFAEAEMVAPLHAADRPVRVADLLK